jgi:hypothetical protein
MLEIIPSPLLDMVEGTIMESRHATFFEDEFHKKNVPSTFNHDSISLETPKPENIAAEESHENIPEEDNGIVTRKSKSRGVAKSFGDDYIIYLVDDTPKTIEEAYSSPDADLWKEALKLLVPAPFLLLSLHLPMKFYIMPRLELVR